MRNGKIGLLIIVCIALLLYSCKHSSTVEIPAPPIQEYHISCSKEDFAALYKNHQDNKYIPIKFTFNGQTVVAKMRIRGDTSRKAKKKSLKIKFGKERIKGLPKKLNLNAEFFDKTYIRQYLSSQLTQLAGNPCFEAAYAKLYLNNQFLGLYLQVENVDKQFLKRNGLSEKGNLYKATKDGACLSIYDDIPHKWEKKTNKKSDYNDLKRLIHAINHVPDNAFYTFVQNNFEYKQFINQLALNMLLSNGSTYYHNYYLYHDMYNSGKWQLFPWDLDKTWSYYNWMPYIYHRTSSEWESDNPLIERALLCDTIFQDIKERITILHENLCNDATVAPVIDRLQEQLYALVDKDTADNISSANEWKKYINKEKDYFDKHYERLQDQFERHPSSFKVINFTKTQTDTITFQWHTSLHPKGKNITYRLTYGPDFLLKDSLTTKTIDHITDTFYRIEQLLPEGKYYWKVTANDGEYKTDGFNTKNMFFVKKGTPVPKIIQQKLTLTKQQSPYLVQEDLLVEETGELWIEEGVEIHLKEDVNIKCNGNIIAHGTHDEPIVFMPDNTANFWGHIYFYTPAKVGYFKNVLFKEGIINSKNTELTLDSCNIEIRKKNLVEGEKRAALVWANKGIIKVLNSSLVSNGKGEGMVLYKVDAHTESSYFENTPDAIEYIQTNRGIISNNLVVNSPDDAVDLNACNNVTIEKNILINSKDKAISIGTEQYGASINNILIKHNLIVGNKTAIAIKDSSVAYISNNTLYNNISGINAYKKRKDYTRGGTAYISNTIFEENEKTNAYADEWSEVQVMNCLVKEKSLPGNNNHKGDPHFIDPSNYNFYRTEDENSNGLTNIGAFPSSSNAINITSIHLDTATKLMGIVMVNNLNISSNLSLHCLLMDFHGTLKKVVFPMGTSIERLDQLFITNNYAKWLNSFPEHGKNVVGGLPKTTALPDNIKLLTPEGKVVCEYTP